jgi:hypothetical protein
MDNHVAERLLRRAKADQTMRNEVMSDRAPWSHAVDRNNTKYLKRLVAQEGWPTTSGVGKEAAHAAWLLAQHADHDPEFQAQCLKLMKSLPDDEVLAMNLAYLEDRVRVHRKQPQRYGTQFYQDGDYYGPRPIEDIENLDTRRQSVGLGPFKDYEAIMEEFRENKPLSN